MMRVTTSTFPDTLVSQLNQLTVRQDRLQNQAATGQRVQLPEDDPTAMRRVLDLQAEDAGLQQYQANIARLQDYSTASFDAIKSLKTISDRAGEIATLADGTKSPQDLQTYATEVQQLIQQAVSLGNSQYQGDYLFAGTRSSQPPFVATQDTNGQVTNVTYQGNTAVASAEIAQGVTLSVQTPGANTTGAGATGLVTDSRTGADLFNHLISLQAHLQAGNTAAIANTDRAALAADDNHFVLQFGTNGALQARLEAASTMTTSRAQAVEQLISKEADADLSQTLVRLNQTQNAYRAALQSGATVLSQTLLNYIQ